MTPAHPKPVRTKKNGHPVRCSCRSCIGSRNRRKGLKKQRLQSKQAGIESHRWGDRANEENYTRTGLGGLFKIEGKSGAQVPKVITNAIAQAERSRAIGDARPIATQWTPEGTTRSLFLCYTDDLLNITQSLGPANEYAIKTGIQKAIRELRELEGML